MLVAAFFGLNRIPCYGMFLAHHGFTAAVIYDHLIGADGRKVALPQEHHAPRVRKKGGYVGRKEILAFAKPDYKRRVPARHDYTPRLVGGYYTEGICASHLGKRTLHSLPELSIETRLHEMRNNLGVGLRLKYVAGLL